MTTDKHTVVLRFLDDSCADANLAAQRLSEFIVAESASAHGEPPELSLSKDQGDTQDLGSTLVLVFGTPFAIAIAKGIAAYIEAVGSRVVIQTRAGNVLASGDGAKNIDVAKTIAALQHAADAEKTPELPAKVSPPAKALPPAKASPPAKPKQRAAGTTKSARKPVKK
ncbi:MAG TPA: hypothetical protein PLW65_12025 [Pseudomonadota bacterium]|nr:hypothetical protein [Pseudomonadota bacterium]